MLFNKYPLQRSRHGFSLVEIMIALAVGMLGILVIMQVFLVSEGQKRTTTGGADAQENALMAMFTLERELRIAGLGLVALGCTPGCTTGCTTVNAWNGTAAYSFSPLPVTIERDTPAAGSDRITLGYSNSPFGNIQTTLTAARATSNVGFTVANADGFRVGDLAIVSQGTLACTLTEITATPTPPSKDLATSGGTYNGAAFPAGGYGVGARLTNMGSNSGMVNHRYYVSPDNNLMMRDLNRADSATNPMALVNGIVAIRAQYGRDTDGDGFFDAYDNTAPTSATEVVAVRLAVVARSGQLEKEAVSPATLVLWNGGTTGNGGAITLDATARQYRYKIYQTTIPLRNVLWTNN